MSERKILTDAEESGRELGRLMERSIDEDVSFVSFMTLLAYGALEVVRNKILNEAEELPK